MEDFKTVLDKEMGVEAMEGELQFRQFIYVRLYKVRDYIKVNIYIQQMLCVWKKMFKIGHAEKVELWSQWSLTRVWKNLNDECVFSNFMNSSLAMRVHVAPIVEDLYDIICLSRERRRDNDLKAKDIAHGNGEK